MGFYTQFVHINLSIFIYQSSATSSIRMQCIYLQMFIHCLTESQFIHLKKSSYRLMHPNLMTFVFKRLRIML